MDEFLNYERYGADGVLIDLLFVLDWIQLKKPFALY